MPRARQSRLADDDYDEEDGEEDYYDDEYEGEEESLPCFCGRKTTDDLDEDSVWVQCERCSRWCHGSCANLTKEQARACPSTAPAPRSSPPHCPDRLRPGRLL